MTYTFRDLGLPSVGEFTVAAMRAHRNPVVRALGALLQSKANYLPGDRWTVASIRPLADDTRMREGTSSVDMSLIEISTMRSFFRTLTNERVLPSGARALPFTRLWIPERQEALDRMLRARYGRDADRLGELHNQHWTFQL